MYSEAISAHTRSPCLVNSSGPVAERIGVSRPTAQRYLASLTDAGAVERSLRYGATGRPENRYTRPA